MKKEKMMRTKWIMTAMILLAASGRAAVITATQNGGINVTTTWGGATLPVDGDTDTWDTAGYTITHGATTFYGGLLSVNSGARLEASTTNPKLVLQATTFDNGGIRKGNNLTATYDFSGKALTFAGGGAEFSSNGDKRNITLANAVWAGSGDISFLKWNSANLGTSVLKLDADNSLSNYTGTISVNNSAGGGLARLVIQAATTGSFGVNIGAGSELVISDEEMEYKFSSLVLGEDTIAAGTYAYTDFTSAQQAYLQIYATTGGTVTVIAETEPTEEPAEIVAIRPVAGGLLELEINAPTPGLSCLKGASNLVNGAWTRVPHSNDGVNEFKQDTLSYSTPSGSNVLIYVQGDAPAAFFGTGPQ